MADCDLLKSTFKALSLSEKHRYFSVQTSRSVNKKLIKPVAHGANLKVLQKSMLADYANFKW